EIGFPEDQPVKGHAGQPLAQRPRQLQPLRDQRPVEGHIRVTPDDARADERMRVHVSVAEELVARRVKLYEAAGLDLRERRGLIVDLVAEDPEMRSEEHTSELQS